MEGDNLARILWKSVHLKDSGLIGSVADKPIPVFESASIATLSSREVPESWFRQIWLLGLRLAQLALLAGGLLRHSWEAGFGHFFNYAPEKLRISSIALPWKPSDSWLLDKKLGRKDYITGMRIQYCWYCYLVLGMGSWCRISFIRRFWVLGCLHPTSIYLIGQRENCSSFSSSAWFSCWVSRNQIFVRDEKVFIKQWDKVSSNKLIFFTNFLYHLKWYTK